MGSHNLVITNLQPNSMTDYRALDLYRLLYDFSRLPTSFYRPASYNKPIQSLHNIVSGCRLTSTPLAAIKDANVFVFQPTVELLTINRTNRIICFVPGGLSDDLLTLLPIIDVIVTYSVYEASIISRQLRRLGYSTPVAKISPPFDTRQYKLTNPSTFKLGYQATADYQMLTMLEPSKAELIPIDGKFPTSFHNISGYYHLETPTWPYDVLGSMISGKAVITPKRPPLTEYIINGYNGLFIRDRHEISDAIEQMDGNCIGFGAKARDIMLQILEPEAYTTEIINIATDKFFNLNILAIPEYTSHNQRKWLFKKEILKNGQMVLIPSNYDESFKVSNLFNTSEILSFLAQQQFQCAYVFGFELNDPTILEMNNIITTAERLGRRGLTVHFCTDEPIPDRWHDVFKNLSIISVTEGIKQVSP